MFLSLSVVKRTSFVIEYRRMLLFSTNLVSMFRKIVNGYNEGMPNGLYGRIASFMQYMWDVARFLESVKKHELKGNVFFRFPKVE